MTGYSKKILMVIDLFHPFIGGAETQAMLLSQELIKRGHKVTILTKRGNKELKQNESVNGIDIHRLPIDKLSGIHKFRSILPAARWLVKNRERYDLIHSHGANPLTWSILPARPFIKKPYFVKLTRTGFLDYVVPPSLSQKNNSGDNLLTRFAKALFRPFLKYFRMKLLYKAKGIFAINTEIEKLLVNSNFKNVVNIPNGVDVEKFAPATSAEKYNLRSTLKLPQNSKIVIYSGRFTEGKNLKRLLHAWYDISQQIINHPSQLVLLGSGEAGKSNLESELKSYAAEQNMTSVSFKGYVANVTEYLKAADIFVLPSLGEGLSNALLEAMACGLPVAASDISGNRDLVKNNINGLLFDPENKRQMADCLEKLITDRDRLEKMSQEARKTIVDSFSVSAVIEKVVKEYNR